MWWETINSLSIQCSQVAREKLPFISSRLHVLSAPPFTISLAFSLLSLSLLPFPLPPSIKFPTHVQRILHYTQSCLMRDLMMYLSAYLSLLWLAYNIVMEAPLSRYTMYPTLYSLSIHKVPFEVELSTASP